MPQAAKPKKVASIDSPARSLPATGEDLGEFVPERFFEQSFDLHCVAGVDGYFRWVNPAWVQTLGWTVQELKARILVAFVHPDDLDSTMAAMGNLADGVDAVGFENRYVCKDGSYRWLEWNARSVAGSGVIHATARDITERKLLEREVLGIAARERERLGRELHDGLCQTLAGIAAFSSTLARKLARSTAPASGPGTGAAEDAAEIERLLNEAVGEARDLARTLGPAALGGAGLDEGLALLALSIQRLFHVTCTCACDQAFPRLLPEVESHLFRITQQAVSNAVTHGKGSRIDVRLRSQNGQGFLTVEDDGVGLQASERNPAGEGMQTMAYRAHRINGRVDVALRPGGGTVVTCIFPLPTR